MTAETRIPERWFRVAVRGGDADLESLVAEILVAEGGKAVVHEDGAWVTYLEAPADRVRWVRHLEQTLLEECGPGWEVTTGWQEHRDWEKLWRSGLGRRRVGERIVVAPSWDLPPEAPDQVLLRIDPGMAFGTAEHATTRISLALVEQAVAPGERVLDVGAGSAILSIAAIRLGAAHALAVESDPYACAEAQENLSRNGVADRVRIEHRMFAGSEKPGVFDGVISNMIRARLMEALPALLRGRAATGWIVLSGCEAGEVPEMVGRLTGQGLVPVAEREEDGWWGGLFRSQHP